MTEIIGVLNLHSPTSPILCSTFESLLCRHIHGAWSVSVTVGTILEIHNTVVEARN